MESCAHCQKPIVGAGTKSPTLDGQAHQECRAAALDAERRRYQRVASAGGSAATFPDKCPVCQAPTASRRMTGSSQGISTPTYKCGGTYELDPPAVGMGDRWSGSCTSVGLAPIAKGP
jgi:hypothetical protein